MYLPSESETSDESSFIGGYAFITQTFSYTRSMLPDLYAGKISHIVSSDQIYSDRKRTLLALKPTALSYDASSPFTNDKFLGNRLISMRGGVPGIDNENNSSLFSFYHSKE
jgi:hypothetical protein